MEITIQIKPNHLLDGEELHLLTQMKIKYNKTNDPLLLIEIMKLSFVESVGFI